ncbi:MAG: AbrB/MazE/SpoVT family DNA-binding domain-containing protein [Euryarchaeota archaeon]|nr:AbrB/MazE/SpoVT family DNA-binding domain-containing protein [Euryarchaeota archaeon]
MPSIGESRVTEGLAASIPAEVRRRLNIHPGDRLVWDVKAEHAEVHVKRGRRSGFADFEPYDFGYDTKGGADHDEAY